MGHLAAYPSRHFQVALCCAGIFDVATVYDGFIHATGLPLEEV
jgi:hypothetical protein